MKVKQPLAKPAKQATTKRAKQATKPARTKATESPPTERATTRATKPKADPPARLGATSLLELRVARKVFSDLRKAHPDAHCELDHSGPFQLLIATVLSAQTTDVQVNRITPELFARYPTAYELALAHQEAVETCLNRIGMFRQKAKNIVALSRLLVENYEGEVPRTLDELVLLPGVGRKTANVVLGVAFAAPEGVVVDTHVGRIAQRLGFTKADKPTEIEQDLMALFPKSEWDILSHTLIFHGRRVCRAVRPACSTCPVSGSCLSAFRADEVGRKVSRPRA